MADSPRPPEVVEDDGEWYTLQQVASALGLSRQAVHARVQKGQLEAQKVGGNWRVRSAAVAEEVQARRAKALSLGSVRVLPVEAPASAPGGTDIPERVAYLEAVVAELADENRRIQGERERELRLLRERGDRLRAALHQMVDLLAAEQAVGSGDG